MLPYVILGHKVDPIGAAVLSPGHSMQDIVREQVVQLHILRHYALRGRHGKKLSKVV